MIEYILEPITLNTFVNDYWDKTPFYIQREKPDYYNNILTIEQVNEYLDRNDIRFPAIRMAKNGVGIPLSEYSSIISIGKYASEGLIDTDKFFNKFNNGATVFLQMMRSSVKSLSTFVSQLEKELRFRVETHLFLTPNHSQGLSAHYDTTSSFIMQVFGNKTWTVYKPILELPAIDQTFNMDTYSGSEKIFEVTLQPGDLIFIPRGFIHEAKTSNEMSLHITTVLCPPTWLDIFNLVVEGLKDDHEFRRSSINHLFKESSVDNFTYLKKKVKALTNYRNIFQSLHDDTQARQVKDNTNRLFDYLNISKINNSSKLAKRKDINFAIIEHGKSVELKFYDKKIEFPNFVLEILNYITENDEFLIKDISNKLDDKGKLVLTRKLIKEGFLKIITL